MFKHLLSPICLASAFLLLIIAVAYALFLVQAPMQTGVLILLSLVLGFMWYSICHDTIRKYDRAMSIKTGQIWQSRLPADSDPWATASDRYTIIGTKKNKKGTLWVSYYIDSRTIKHEKVWDFCDHAELIHDIE